MEASRERQLQRFIAEPTGYDALIGLRFRAASSSLVEAELEVEPRHLQIHGMVHGGVYAALVETTCSVGASLAGNEGRNAVGVENHTSFLSAARLGTRLAIAARPLATSRRTALWEATITDCASSRLAARGQVRFLLIPSAQSAPPGGAD